MGNNPEETHSQGSETSREFSTWESRQIVRGLSRVIEPLLTTIGRLPTDDVVYLEVDQSAYVGTQKPYIELKITGIEQTQGMFNAEVYIPTSLRLLLDPESREIVAFAKLTDTPVETSRAGFFYFVHKGLAETQIDWTAITVSGTAKGYDCGRVAGKDARPIPQRTFDKIVSGPSEGFFPSIRTSIADRVTDLREKRRERRNKVNWPSDLE